MRFVDSLRRSESVQFGPLLIGTGLATLIAATWWPDALVLTAVAAIILGATQLTLARFRCAAALVPVLILHGAIYAGLYGVFVGAVLHGARLSSTSGLSGFAAIDLAVSIAPIAIALKQASSCLRQSTVSRH
jgi:hypothetical protein